MGNQSLVVLTESKGEYENRQNYLLKNRHEIIISENL